MRERPVILVAVGLAAIVGPAVAAFVPGALLVAGLLPAALPLVAVLLVRALDLRRGADPLVLRLPLFEIVAGLAFAVDAALGATLTLAVVTARALRADVVDAALAPLVRGAGLGLALLAAGHAGWRSLQDPLTALLLFPLAPLVLEAARPLDLSPSAAGRRLLAGAVAVCGASWLVDPLLCLAALVLLAARACAALAATPRRARRSAMGVVLASTTAAVMGEVGCRVALRPPAWEVSSAPWLLTTDPELAVWHRPFAQTRHRRPMFDVTYTSNAFGMRDRARDEVRRGPRVAVLGDSMVEGYGVGDEETFTRGLETRLGVEVLNFGSSGGVGATEEWCLHHSLARRFAPDLVLLCLNPDNDLLDDGEWLNQTLAPQRRAPFLTPVAGGFDVQWHVGASRPRGHDGPLTAALAPWSQALEATLSLRDRLRRPSRPSDDLREQTDVYLTFAKDPPPHWREAWAAIGEALRRLRDEVQRDGARLVVVILPSALQVDPAFAARLVASGLDPRAPTKHMEALVADLGVPCVPLLPLFERERDARRLSYPYFSFDGDGHWSAFGHAVAAEVLAAELTARGLVPR